MLDYKYKGLTSVNKKRFGRKRGWSDNNSNCWDLWTNGPNTITSVDIVEGGTKYGGKEDIHSSDNWLETKKKEEGLVR